MSKPALVYHGTDTRLGLSEDVRGQEELSAAQMPQFPHAPCHFLKAGWWSPSSPLTGCSQRS